MRCADTHRAEHRAWVQSGGEGRAVVLIGSALLDEDGQAIGNWGVLQAADMGECPRLCRRRCPFFAQVSSASVELTPLPETFQGAPYLGADDPLLRRLMYTFMVHKRKSVHYQCPLALRGGRIRT